MEQRVRELEARETLGEQSSLDGLIESIQAGVVVHGGDGAVINSNTAAQTMLGLTHEQMLGKELIDPAWTFLREDGSPMPVEEYPVSRVISTKKPVYNLVAGIRRSDKAEPIWVLDTAIPDFGGDGRIRQIITSFMDISALKKSEEKYRSLFENTMDEVHLWKLVRDEHGSIKTWKLVDVNPAALKAWGKTRPEIIGKTTNEIFSFDSTKHFMPIVKKIFSEGAPHTWETYFPPTGQFYHMTSVPFKEYFFSTGTDITERKKTEEALKDSEERLRALVNTNPFPIVVTDAAREKILYWSKSAKELFGYEPKTPAEWFSLAYPDPQYRQAVIDRSKPYLERAQHSKTAVNTGEYQIVCRDGSVKICEFYAQFIPGHLVLTSNDITERKQAEEALKSSLIDLKLAHNIANIGNWHFDPEIGVPVWSDQVYAIYNRDPEQGPPHIDEYKKIYEPEQFPIFNTAIQQAIKKGAPYDIILKLKLPGDIVKWIHAICQPDEKSGPAGHFLRGTIQDITERKQAEMKLHEYSERLEGMVEERTQEILKIQEELMKKERLAVIGHFAGSVSHELRNPLAAVDSSAYLLKMKLGNSDEKLSKHLESISRNVNKSTSIIQSLLNLSRMEKPRSEKIDMKDLLSETLASTKIPAAVEVVLDLPESPPFIAVEAEQIRMVLKNIIQNAVQAMNGKGSITISAHPVEADRIELAVGDTGPGILPEHIEKIFEPLFSTKTHGIGFGLSITKMIVENHGGTIRTESEPGKGATFIVSLPVAK